MRGTLITVNGIPKILKSEINHCREGKLSKSS